MRQSSADALIDESLACRCDVDDGPLCARCECLMLLVEAIDIWTYEHLTGCSWEGVMCRIRQEQVQASTPLGLSEGMWYTLLGLSAQAYMVAHYLCWTLPRWAWLTWTGQLPPPSKEESWTDTGKEGKF